MRRPVALIVAILLVAGVFGVSAGAATAGAQSRTFCDNWLAPDGTCPPNGVSGGSEWGHLEEIQGNSAGESRSTCIDAYLEEEELGERVEGFYTASKCMYYSGETARWEPPVEYAEPPYGRPRAWNNGKVDHTVWGWEYF